MCGCCKLCTVGCAVWVTDAGELKFWVCCCGLETATGVLLTGGCCFFLSESLNQIQIRNWIKFENFICVFGKVHKEYNSSGSSISVLMGERVCISHLDGFDYTRSWKCHCKKRIHQIRTEINLLYSTPNIDRPGLDYHRSRIQNGTSVALDLIHAPFLFPKCFGI